MRPHLLDAGSRDRLVERLRALSQASEKRFGALSAGEMVCHLTDQLRVALGEIPATDRGNLLSRTLLRFLVLHVGVPVPKGKVQTAPEMLLTEAGEFECDRGTLIEVLGRFAERSEGDAWPTHPFFGRLSGREWSRLSWIHADHHLRQFGV